MTDLKLSETFTVVDVETTGFDPLEDRVVEVAAQRINWATGEAGEMFCTRVNPGRPIPAAASAVHHITDAMVADAPPFAEVLDGLARELVTEGPTLPVLVAHAAPFDAKFLLAETARVARADAGVRSSMASSLLAILQDARLACTYRLALHLVDAVESYKLQALRYALELPVRYTGVHGAGEDVAVHRELYLHLLERWLRAREAEHHTAAPQDLGLADPTPAELLAFCWAPIRHRRMPRGKHAGVPLAEVPLDYLAWAARKKPWAGYSDDLQTCVEAELARRVENRR